VTNTRPGNRPMDRISPSFTLTLPAKICKLAARLACCEAALLPSFDAETRALFGFCPLCYLGHDAVSKLITRLDDEPATSALTC
jgi:hypothetical protein